MGKCEFLTISEALSKLALYDRAEELMSELTQLQLPNNPMTDSDYEIESNTPEGYGIDQLRKDFLGETDNLDSAVLESTERLPEIGDIALLAVKLNSPKPSKKLYLSYERRPVLILSVHDKTVDGVEITHSATYLGNELINIGKLADSKNSYVNIYNSDNYKNLATDYKFPLFDVKSDTPNKPLTKAEVGERCLGKLYKKQKEDESIVYLVSFNYKNNFIKKISAEKLNSILDALAAYIEEKK